MNYRHVWLVVVLLAFAACSDEPNTPISSPDSRLNKADSPELQTGEIDLKDRYVVVFKESVSNVDRVVDEVTRGNGSAVHFRYRHALKGFAATLPPQALEAIKRNPNVDYVEPDGIATKNQQSNPPSWGLDRIDQRALPLNQTYNYQNNGAGVRVYIIDTGIRFDHQEFNNRASSGWDFVDNDANAYDCDGHGTHVAGTIGGTNVGVAKGVTLIAVRVLNCRGSGSWSGVIAGVDWVTATTFRPAVANMSLGGGYYAPLNTAVANSIAAGVVYAVAAGNENQNACSYSPASTPTALTVGATTSGDVRSSFSNYGSCVDIFAPGSSIYSSTMTGTNTYASWSGTSMACPHVAGVAALYLGANPTATTAQVETAIKSNATSNVLSSIGTNSPNSLLYSLILGPPPPAPDAPTNLAVTNATNTSIALEWVHNSINTTSFSIQRASGSNGLWSTIGTVLPTVKTFTNTGLAPANTYFYRVIAYNGSTPSLPSNTISGTTTNTTTNVDIAGVSGFRTGNTNAWYGNIVVTVRDAANALVSGVTVTVTYGNSSKTGVTDGNGVVTITTSKLKHNVTSVTMNVTNLSGTGLSSDPNLYQAATSVTLYRP